MSNALPVVTAFVPTEPPYVLAWHDPHCPLPVRHIRSPLLRSCHPLEQPAQPWLPSGPPEMPFDFSGHVRRLCADIVARCAELGHIEVSRLLFGATQARNGRTFGLQARTTPMRFRNGALQRKRRGRWYQVQRYFVDSREMMYLVTFYLPRFLDAPFDEKFITLFHELYHIGPEFDGDLRRHAGRYAIHSQSKRAYDEFMAHLAREYLASGADPDLNAFLRLNFAQLQYRHREVAAVMVPRPRILPIPARSS